MMTNMQKNPAPAVRRSYLRVQVALHWAIAVLVLGQLVVNDEVRLAFGLRLTGQDAHLPMGAAFHIAGGLIVLGLTLLRLALRLVHGVPPAPPGAHPLIRLTGEWAHRGLYVLLFLATLTGAVAWFLNSETAATWHELARMALVALILGHILGALVEHYIIGNRVIRRMAQSGGTAIEPPVQPDAPPPAS